MNDSNNLSIISQVTKYVSENDFSGWCKHDALNSPILKFLSFKNKWPRLIFVQGMMRFPINLRRIFLVEKSRNPKGIALFAKSYLLLYQSTGDKEYKDIAVDLLNWLIENHSNKAGKYHGYCWGYNFAWQSPFFYAPKYSPNLTVTVFPGEAFILASLALKKRKYLEFARGAADFLLNDLPILYETSWEKCLGYVPKGVTQEVINVNSMTAAFLAKLYKVTKIEIYKEEAIKLVNFVASRAIDGKKWTYTTDVRHSYVDNYHTGGIIDEMLETMENLNYWKWEKILNLATEYYRSRLFTEEGAPKNTDKKKYPYDIHGAAQGIITFSKMSRINIKYLKMAERILDWTIDNLYSGEGYFYYQKTRFFTKKFTFMRWCNAWMLYALSEYTYANKNNAKNL